MFVEILESDVPLLFGEFEEFSDLFLQKFLRFNRIGWSLS
jgi:hypothetical protein